MVGKFYILILMPRPAFISDDEGEPQPFDTEDEAHALAADHTACQHFGFVLLDYDAIELRD